MGKQAAAPAIDRGAVHILDVLSGGISFQPNQFQQAHLRNHEPFAAACDYQARNDGQRERNPDLDGGAFAGRLKTSTTPPIFSMWDLTTSMPTPRPEILVTVCAVENPGRKIRLSASRSLSLLRLFRPEQSFLYRLLLDPRDIDPRAVVADLDVDLAAFVKGAKGQSPLRRLARPHSHLRRFDAMVAGVANQVHQRVLDGLDDGPVEFRLRAIHLQAGSACRAQTAMSRTTRGSLFHTTPMGCMRVFITPSCNSVVIRFSRWRSRSAPHLPARC